MNLNQFKEILPNKVPICGVFYVIEYCLKIHSDDPDEVLHGLTHPDARKIEIALNTPSFMKKTLLHEVIHAILAQTGYGTQLEAVNDKFEEAIVICLEENLGQLIKFQRIWPERKINKAYELVKHLL